MVKAAWQQGLVKFITGCYDVGRFYLCLDQQCAINQYHLPDPLIIHRCIDGARSLNIVKAQNGNYS